MRKSTSNQYILYTAIVILVIFAGVSISKWFDVRNETNCNYISSRGILKSCDIHSSDPVSSINTLEGYNFSGIKDGSIVYIASSAIPAFVKHFSAISHRIVLVTGDADESVPGDVFPTTQEFLEFIENGKIIHWFAQNCTIYHKKLTQIPIGLDYHTMARRNHKWGLRTNPVEQEDELLRIRKDALDFYKRKIMCYSNFHFNYKGSKFGYDRAAAIEEIPADLIHYESRQTSRSRTWKAMTEYAFVVSPAGNGLDCHRTWEALCLGCIPIVKTSAIDPLYTDLPVLIVKSWSDITQTKLEDTITEFRKKNFKYDRLQLSYWVDVIRAANQ